MKYKVEKGDILNFVPETSQEIYWLGQLSMCVTHESRQRKSPDQPLELASLSVPLDALIAKIIWTKLSEKP